MDATLLPQLLLHKLLRLTLFLPFSKRSNFRRRKTNYFSFPFQSVRIFRLRSAACIASVGKHFPPRAVYDFRADVGRYLKAFTSGVIYAQEC